MRALRRALTARLTAGEDPNDVYRVRVPAKRSVAVTVRSDTDVDLELWRPWTTSVLERDGNLAAVSARRGRGLETARFRNRAPSDVYAFVNVRLPVGVPRATYRVSVAVRP